MTPEERSILAGELALAVSTGIGAGLVLGGRLWRGRHGIARAVGHGAVGLFLGARGQHRACGWGRVGQVRADATAHDARQAVHVAESLLDLSARPC